MDTVYAGVAELADAQDLGSCAAKRAGSSPVTRTNQESYVLGLLYMPERSFFMS